MIKTDMYVEALRVLDVFLILHQNDKFEIKLHHYQN